MAVFVQHKPQFVIIESKVETQNIMSRHDEN